MFFTKPNKILRTIFSNYTWKMPPSTTEKVVYLTFDDGPTPEITEWVLATLKKENVKATFFCIGNNIQKNKEIFKKIHLDSHTIGNHTYNHFNGWKTSTNKYIQNVNLYEKTINEFSIETKKIFRPPYGKITPFQAKKIMKKGYEIVMWSVLSYDFLTTITPEKCLQNVLKNVENGSIIVFHDSVKASKNLYYVLPKVITHLKNKGFVFKSL